MTRWGDPVVPPEIGRFRYEAGDAEVIEKWLFDHGGNASFLTDYGALDVSEIRWTQEEVPVEQLRDTITADGGTTGVRGKNAGNGKVV